MENEHDLVRCGQGKRPDSLAFSSAVCGWILFVIGPALFLLAALLAGLEVK